MKAACAIAALSLFLASCRPAALGCVAEDLGGWMVDVESDHGVHHYCSGNSERFVLQVVTSRREDGRMPVWADLATLDVELRRGESTMAGFECGGNGIAVGHYRRDGSFDVKRAWRVDVQNRRFVAVPPDSVVCESLE